MRSVTALLLLGLATLGLPHASCFTTPGLTLQQRHQGLISTARQAHRRGPTALGGGEELSEGRRALIALGLAPIFAIATTYAVVPLALNSKVRQQGWYKEKFADGMQGMAGYEAGIEGVKKDLFSVVDPTDKVLDLGAGLAPNMKYLPTSISYTAVEPNIYMHPSIRVQAERVLDGGAKNEIFRSISEVASGSQDIVVSTLVLCSVQDQPGMLVEIQRVLKPGGMLLFLEHVAADDQGYPAPGKTFDWDKGFYRWAQQAMTPLQVALADGCHPARDTIKEISTVFPETFFKRFDVPALWGEGDKWLSFFPIGPQVAGIAVKGKSKYAGQYAEVQFKFCAPTAQQAPLMATPDGDSDAQREWQDSGAAKEALSASQKQIKCQ